jgi:hypothetical protein
MKITMGILLISTVCNFAFAGEVQILAADFHSTEEKHWSVNVTLQHDDTGWDHYADNWRIVDSEENVLGDRLLAHPHVTEQPFTRGLGSVNIPEHITTVYIEAHDKVHGWTKNRLKVDLNKATGRSLRVEAK